MKSASTVAKRSGSSWNGKWPAQMTDDRTRALLRAHAATSAD
jgi:hypothetical protein